MLPKHFTNHKPPVIFINPLLCSTRKYSYLCSLQFLINPLPMHRTHLMQSSSVGLACRLFDRVVVPFKENDNTGPTGYLYTPYRYARKRSVVRPHQICPAKSSCPLREFSYYFQQHLFFGCCFSPSLLGIYQVRS